jgi:hypothetical protein
MAFLERNVFPPFAPDLSDNLTQTSQTIYNVVPRADGYGPFFDFQSFSQPLPNAACRGSFFARNNDGTITIFAGDTTNLYVLNNSTLIWNNADPGGVPYTALPVQGQWQFEQFDNTVIAVQANAAPQAYTLQVSTQFAALGGTPPQASYVAIVNRFVVLSGLTSSPFRIQWSDLDAPTVWTPGTGQADFQDLPDGGQSKMVLGFDLYGVIFQDNIARLLTYSAGSPVIFTITKITGGDGNGLFAPYGSEIDQDNVFWISQEGFKMMSPGGAPTPIGKEIIDRFFFSSVDTSNLYLVLMSTDPAVSRLYIAYKSLHGPAGQYDTILVYDWELQRWSLIQMTGQYILPISKPGVTEEVLDSITPGAVSVTGAGIGGNNGAGGNYIRLTVSSTSGMAAALQQTGPWSAAATGSTPRIPSWNVTQIVSSGAPSLANATMYYNGNKMGRWTISVIDGTHIDLINDDNSNPSVWVGGMTWASGGFVGGNEDLFPFSFDTISTATLPQFANFQNGVLGFHLGPALQAVLDTAEQGTQEARIQCNGLRLITDSPDAQGSVSYRENASSPINYTTPVPMVSTGVAPQRMAGRYMRARMTIPYGSVWSFAMGVEPDGITLGNR